MEGRNIVYTIIAVIFIIALVAIISLVGYSWTDAGRMDIKDGVLVKVYGTDTDYVVPSNIHTIGKSAFKNKYKLEYVNLAGVKEVGEEAFVNCININKVDIGEGTEIIGDNAFSGTYGLESVYIPASVTHIGKNAFENGTKITISPYNKSYYMDNDMLISKVDKSLVNYYGDGIEGDMYVPHGVRKIGPNALAGSKATRVILPYGIEEIGEHAFFASDNLKEVVMQDGVRHIGYGAFRACDNLENIYIPKSVEIMGALVFNAVPKLQLSVHAMSAPAGWAKDWCGETKSCVWNVKDEYRTIDGVKYCIQDRYATVVGVDDNVTDVQIRDNIKLSNDKPDVKVIAINNTSFTGNVNIERIYIPNSVKIIGEDAFKGCSKAHIDINAKEATPCWAPSWNVDGLSVLWDADNYFESNGILYHIEKDEASVIKILDKKIDIDIPIKVTYRSKEYNVVNISKGAFSDIAETCNVNIKETLVRIEDGAFTNCPNLTIYTSFDAIPSDWQKTFADDTIDVEWGISGSATIDDIKYILQGDNAIIYEVGDMAGELVIRDYLAYNGKSYKLTKIAAGAFADNAKLNKVFIPASIELVGYNAFKGCANLTIYLEAQEKPSGWRDNWNPDNLEVVFNAQSNVLAEYNEAA